MPTSVVKFPPQLSDKEYDKFEIMNTVTCPFCRRRNDSLGRTA